jgi:large conductance mechanosensitive channel
MGMITEFKQFAMRGNVVDLAVGVVIGAAFGKIVSSLVDHVIMPPIGLLIGGVDFSSWKIPLAAAVIEGGQVVKPAVELGIGTFLNTIVQFTIIAFAIFLVVKVINAAKKSEPAPPPAEPPADVKLLTEIRDLLAKR